MEQNHMLGRHSPRSPSKSSYKKDTLFSHQPASTIDSLAALAAVAPAPTHLPFQDPSFDKFQPRLDLSRMELDRYTSPLPLHPRKSLPPLGPPSSYSKLPISPPSYSQSRRPDLLAFPDAPKAELAPLQPLSEAGLGARITTLPSLSSVTGSSHHSPTLPQPRDASPPAQTHWPSLNPFTAYYAPSHAQTTEPPLKMDLDPGADGAHGAAHSMSPDRFHDGRASSVSLDDPDVRLAAEALGDLRADFISSPPNHSAPLPTTSPGHTSEPLLSLLTTSHPLLATTIEGATSAYNNSKNFSPRFKSSAEYVEGYLTPIANTVGSVGRVTGVEGSVRWFLGGGRRYPSSDMDEGSNKRRKVDKPVGEQLTLHSTERASIPGAEIYGHRERRTSMSTVDTLPAYDDQRSPAYSESEGRNQVAQRPGSRGSTAWQHRLIMSTSGLSIAMSEESLRSLRYCLQWLRWANEHIAKLVAGLKSGLEQYDRPSETIGEEPHGSAGESSPSRSELVAHINSMKTDVLKTLRDVISTVSKYAGGALPENARELVKRHLTSLPHRFRLATMQDTPTPAQEQTAEAKEQECKEGAQKVLVLAKEGLDMMSQISGVLDGTIVSAEEWCDRLGKKKREQRDALGTGDAPRPTEALVGVTVDGDVHMG